MQKPVAYDGNEPFIFISYSHRDSDQVWPIINRMLKDGYRVWYDDGIDPGTEWDEFIASKIISCDYFIGFMSENYLNSSNCKDELNYARDHVDNRLLVYLEDVTLPGGMEMRLSRIQAIHKFNFANEEDFYTKFYMSKNMNMFVNAPVAPVTPVAPAPAAPVAAPVAPPPVAPVAPPPPAPATPRPQNVPPRTAPQAKPAKPPKTFEYPETKWGRWGLPGFRRNNALHMVIAIFGYVIIGIYLIGIFTTLFKARTSRDVGMSLTLVLVSIPTILFGINYGFVQDKWFHFYKMHPVVRIIVTILATIAVAFVGLILALMISFFASL